MLKAKLHPTYLLPCSLLISKICEFKGVNIDGEHAQRMIEVNWTADNSLKQMKFIRFWNSYIHKDDVP